MMTVNDIRIDFKNLLAAEKFVTDKNGSQVLEIIGASFIADEKSIFGEVSDDYVSRELQWYKSMSLNVNDIPGKVPEIWKSIASPAGFVNSNYGWCIWSPDNGNQYDNCLNELIKYPESRRATMIYTRPTMHADCHKDGMADFMCTNVVNYLLRDGKLHGVVQMRSNDALFGYKNDRAWAEYVLRSLVDDYNEITKLNIMAGNIYWNAASLHVYSRHFYLVNSSPKYTEVYG